MAESAEEDRVEEQRPVWSLNRDDKRLLYVTFLGGLAANIGLVLVVGLGLAVAKQLASKHPDRFAEVFVYVGFALGGFAVLIGFVMYVTALNMTPDRPIARALLRVLAVAFALFMSVILIGLIGAAAGIK